MICESCNIPFFFGGGESISRSITLLFVLCLLFSCYAEITRGMLKIGCESDVSNFYISIIPTVCAYSW
jgi:hypothetical protein